MHHRPITEPRRIVLAAFEGAQSLDFVGPLEVFAIAERLSPGRYSTELVAPGGRPFATGSGLTVSPNRSTRACRGPIDTLVVAGGQGVREALRDGAFIGWLRDAAGRSRRVTSVCTGAFLLAEAGLLKGRRATTHWASADRLAKRYPGVEVDPESIFVRDGSVWTSAGVTAGMDLALALAEDDLASIWPRDCSRRPSLRPRRWPPSAASARSRPSGALSGAGSG